MDIITIYKPLNRLDGVIKLITEVASMATGVVLIRLIPKALSIPSRSDLDEANAKFAQANSDLLEEVTRRAQAEEALLKLNRELEERVGRRTSQLEEAIQESSRAQRKLSNALEDFTFLADSLPQIVFTTDVNGSFTYINKQCTVITGFTLDQIEGHFNWLKMLCPDDQVNVQKKWQHSIKTGDEFEVENRFRRVSDGAWIWFLTRALPQRNEDGVIEQWFGTSTDIHERKNFESALLRAHNVLEDNVVQRTVQLENAVAALHSSNQDLEQFAYVASHDLKEPLRMVSSYTQLLAKKYASFNDAVTAEYVGYTVEGVRRMERLISDLLDYSRIGKKQSEPQSLPLDEVMDYVSQNLGSRLDENNGKLIVHKPLPTVIAVQSHMIRLLQNLVDNALKFRGKDLPQIEVGEEETKDQNTVGIYVKDNGIGLDPAYAERVFVIFQRLHSREQYPGTGIGLAVAKKIVEQHGGTIWITSEGLGHGSIFHFTLSKDGPRQTEPLLNITSLKGEA